MMWFYGGGGGWAWLWMGGMMVLFWVGIFLLAIWVIRMFSGPKQTGDTALDILRRRLAAGEISPEEFETTKKALGA
jgi:putative membrane protein